MNGVQPRAVWRCRAASIALLVCVAAPAAPAQAQDDRKARLPQITAPVNDFAGVIDAASAAQVDRTSRALQAKTGDVIVVVTVDTIEGYADIREYAVELFENLGRGIGDRTKDNGLMLLLAASERRVWVEVGYGLEGAITDGFAGETSRDVMVPYFRRGQYGQGLAAGVARFAARIAEDRGVTLDGVPAAPAPRVSRRTGIPLPLLLIIAVIVLQMMGRSRRRRRSHGRMWTGGPWSGWSGGVGPFGGSYGGWGGGFGGFSGGGGGGFGGFGGGRSGGGGGGAGW